MSDSVDTRVLEAKLDAMTQDLGTLKTTMERLADAVVRLAIVEERQAQASQSVNRLIDENARLSARLGTLEAQQPMQRQTSEWVGKVVGIVLTVVVTALVSTVVVRTQAPAAPVAIGSR
jgi:hypothetical protein